MSYSQTYMEHFSAPRNVGEIVEPDVTAEVEHKGGGCFDRIRLTLKLSDGTVQEIMFKARACSGTIAAASAATEWAKGKTLAELRNVDGDLIERELDGVPEKKRHSVDLAAEALVEAAKLAQSG